MSDLQITLPSKPRIVDEKSLQVFTKLMVYIQGTDIHSVTHFEGLFSHHFQEHQLHVLKLMA